MVLRAFLVLGVVFGVSQAQAAQCRAIIRGAFMETIHPNGAVALGAANQGKIHRPPLRPAGTRVWCAVHEPDIRLFAVRRLLKADRLGTGHGQIVDFAERLE